MFKNAHKFLIVMLCACVSGTVSYAYADEVTDIMRDSQRLSRLNNGDASGEIFEDVEYLQGLLESINWANSANVERRRLYDRLTSAVSEIDMYEQSEISQKREDVASAKEKEQSTANKMLGAASMAVMGLGGMSLGAALSEQAAMNQAEAEMQAYLATFTCRYTDGKSVAGGLVDIELPGANELMPLVTEYKELATSLKARKEALNLATGIESEIVYDQAGSGLYDDVSLGKTDGVFTSVARALADANSDDAQKWNADKEALGYKIKDSATTLAVGAVASIAANMAINGLGNNAVVTRADQTRQEVRKILDEIIANCNAAIEQSGQDIDLITGYEDLGNLEGHPICN